MMRGAGVMMPVAAPADKRFRRAHVSPRASADGGSPRGGRIARVGTACLVARVRAVFAPIGFVLAADALTMTRITVQGNQRMSRGEVLGLLDGLSRHQHA